MKKEFVKGAVVMLTRSNNPTTMHMVGTPRVIDQRELHPSGLPGWNFDPPVSSALGEVWWLQKDMIVMDGKPGEDEVLTRVGKPTRQQFIDEAMKNGPASKRLTEAEFEAAQDRWIQGVDL